MKTLLGIFLLIRSVVNPGQKVKWFFLMAVVNVDAVCERNYVRKYCDESEYVCRFLMILLA